MSLSTVSLAQNVSTAFDNRSRYSLKRLSNDMETCGEVLVVLNLSPKFKTEASVCLTTCATFISSETISRF